MKIIGISSYYHDSAAVIVVNGEIVAAAQEERFTRIKNDESFPVNAIKFCLAEAVLSLKDIDAIVFYDKPFLKFERYLQTHFENTPKGWWQFIKSTPAWLKEKLFIKDNLKKEFEEIEDVDWKKTSLLFSKHHLSHAASSFFASPFQSSAVLTIDGVGEWATASIAIGENNSLKTIKELHFPDSIGLLYTSFTYFLGFKVNNGEYKVMGLAPYADRSSNEVQNFVKKIKDELIVIFEDGSIELNKSYFRYATSYKMINEDKFSKLFGFSKRDEDETIEDKHFNLAAALQIVLEEVVLKMVKETYHLTQQKNLCLAGGVALNCVANGRIQEESDFENIFIQPAAGDAGGALGAALSAYYMHFKNERIADGVNDKMKNSALGPSFSNDYIHKFLINEEIKSKYLDEDDLLNEVANFIVQGKVVAWFQGKMEYGPRALGNRSILANPLLKETQSVLNLKVKKRESFRPFAPIMLKEEFTKYFDKDYDSPYMLMVHKIKDEYRISNHVESQNLIEKINVKRSVLPAISHIDYSSRIQTVGADNNLKLFKLLNKFKEKTGVGVLVNTSFNIKGEPIVCTPQDAVHCFKNTDIDVLVMENYVILKENY